jgi:CMP-N,N'-diacetyllegionaminic acid synthase
MLAVIAARGGSKRLPRKHLLPLAGVPMIEHSIRAALGARGVDRLLVTTDDPEIATTARRAGADVPFMRPAELATDTVPARLACLHALDRLAEIEGRRRESFVMIQATCPLVDASDIDAAIDAYEQARGTAAVTVAPARQHLEGVVAVDEGGFIISSLRRDYGLEPRIMPSQMHGPRFYITGAAMVLHADRLRSEPEYVFRDPHVVAVLIPEERAIDIDTAIDFAIAEFLMSRLAAA